MNELITSIQPPGLMKMRLMHHQEHHLGHQAPQNILDEVVRAVMHACTGTPAHSRTQVQPLILQLCPSRDEQILPHRY